MQYEGKALFCETLVFHRMLMKPGVRQSDTDFSDVIQLKLMLIPAFHLTGQKTEAQEVFLPFPYSNPVSL
jgi:hypothetical protein